MDLAGNTFWEFKDSITANRFRRIAQYGPQTHYSDIKISRMPFHTHFYIYRNLDVADTGKHSTMASMASSYTS